MRKFISLVLLTAIGLFSFTNAAQAQQKVGYFDAEATIAKMAEVKAARAKLEALGKQLQAQYDLKVDKFQTKYQEGLKQAQEGTLAPIQQKALETELAQMQKDIVEFEQKIQSDLVRKEEELLKPILDRVNQAVEQTAKEKGFSYIINSNLLIYKDPTGDIGPSVEKKLGLQ